MKCFLPKINSTNKVRVAEIFITWDARDDHLIYECFLLEFQSIIKVTCKRFYLYGYRIMYYIENEHP